MKKSLVVTCALALVTPAVAAAAGPTGAIFTTTPDGTIVNENVRYETKLEVYLDGGPGPNAPQTAAGLDAGLYVFQVTDPPGKRLLSQDPGKCRVVEVKDGVIFREVPATELGSLSDSYSVNGKTYPCRIQDGDPANGVAGPSGRHDWNYDADHGPTAKVVQLMPYGTTPNPGGVYKAWMTPLDKYTSKGGLLEKVPVALKGRDAMGCPDFCGEPDPGFLHPDVKTDNFKVKLKKEVPPPEIWVYKFHDRDMDGAWEEGEEEVTGWQVTITEPSGVAPVLYTRVEAYPAYEGSWTVREETPAGTVQTVALLGSALPGSIQSLYPAANPLVSFAVTSEPGKKTVVVYGNVGLGSAKACKIYDRDGDGVKDEGEPGLQGWKMELTGTTARGAPVGPLDQLTGADGCTTFTGLLPGDYLLTEILPAACAPGCSWEPSGPTAKEFSIASSLSGSTMTGTAFSWTFLNHARATADFGTKGYWHNKNGLDELVAADIDHVNDLPPYEAPSSYFDAGDEPFDGFFADGTPVAGAKGDWGDDVAPAGSPKAEVSHFLVDANAGADPREQLAQQLLAFIFNVRHRLGGDDAAILVNGEWITAGSLVDAAIDAWSTGTAEAQHDMQELLDGLNNMDALPYIPLEPCPFWY